MRALWIPSDKIAPDGVSQKFKRIKPFSELMSRPLKDRNKGSGQGALLSLETPFKSSGNNV